MLRSSASGRCWSRRWSCCLLAGSWPSSSGSASCRCSCSCAASSGGSPRRTAWSGSRSATCSARSRSPSSAPTTVRAYAIEERTQERIDAAIDRAPAASTRAQGLTAFSFSSGVLVSPAWPTPAVRRRRRAARRRRRASPGRAARVRFLVHAVRRPGADRHPGAHRAQNAVAGWRRVIGVLDTPADVGDPGDDGVAAAARADRRPVRARRRSPTRRPARAARRRPRACRRAPGSRWSARPARARRRSPSCSPG